MASILSSISISSPAIKSDDLNSKNKILILKRHPKYENNFFKLLNSQEKIKVQRLNRHGSSNTKKKKLSFKGIKVYTVKFSCPCELQVKDLKIRLFR